MEDDCAEGDKKPSITFTLVHGTFAKGADWVHNDKDEDKFRHKLRTELKEYNIDFEHVDWGNTGILNRLRDNTNKQRFHGVEELKKHLLHCEEATPKNSRYIVTHSHAGNIAMYALRDTDLHNKITGLISLSSPFLKYEPVTFDRSLLFFSGLVLALFAYDKGTLGIWIYTLLYLVAMITMLVTDNFGKTPESEEKIKIRLADLEFPEEDLFENKSDGLSYIAIRPHRDEVTRLFLTTSFIGGLFRRLWGIVNRYGTYMVLAHVLVGWIGPAVESLPFAIDMSWFYGFRSQLDQLVLTPMLLGVTLVLSIMIVMRLSYAFDSIPWLAAIDVRSEIVPWASAEKAIIPTWGWLKHSYIQNQSPPKIAEWIRKIHG